MMDENFFSGYVDKQVMCGERPLPLPLKFKEIRAMMGYFPVKASLIKPMLPAGLSPVSFFGYGIVGLAGIEYRDVNIGPYDEIAVQTLVRYIGKLPPQARQGYMRERVGMHIMIISVTTQEASDSGIHIWGYPKFISQIEFQDQGDQRECRWRIDGQEVLRLTMTTSGFSYLMNAPMVNFSQKENELLKNVLYCKFPLKMTRGGPNVRVVYGTHPLGQKIKDLIGDKKAIASCSFEKGLGVLDVPDWSVRLSS